VTVYDEIFGVIDCRGHLALQSDRVADPFAFRCTKHPKGLVAVAAERPFTIDVLPSFEGGRDRYVVIGHLHADRDEINIGVLRKLCRIRERQWNSEMSGCHFD